MHVRLALVPLSLLITLAGSLARGGDADFDRTRDVIYGRKHGMALTLDVFRPKVKPNGLGLIYVVSGGWYSSHDAITPSFPEVFIRRGYTVFAVVHGSQPKFTIPEAIDDLNRAVRYIRHEAKTYQIDPNELGIFGLSAGGHLSLMQATAGDLGKNTPLDSIGRTSSRVQAVAAFFPPTDFLDYGKPGEVALGTGTLHAFHAPFDFHHFDPVTNTYVPITDPKRLHEIGQEISPVTHVTHDDPPTLIIHGDADQLVPIQQAQIILEKLKMAGVETKLVVKKGGSHGWPEIVKELEMVADWFDAHLKQPKHA